MSENSGENETYHDYSVDDEDQPQGDGDSLVGDRGLAEPLDEGYSPPEKWSVAEGSGSGSSWASRWSSVSPSSSSSGVLPYPSATDHFSGGE